MSKKTVFYVVDQKGWVQHHRLYYLKKFQHSFKLVLLTKRRFLILWYLGILKKRFIFFSNWRIVHALLKKKPLLFSDADFTYFMVGVTSHSTLGGGLNPLNPIPGRTPEEAFFLATKLLKKFKLVSVNSLILYNMLKIELKNLVYCPNGVDTHFFSPCGDKAYNPAQIRIGWVGRVRGAKNMSVVEEACDRLRLGGNFEPKIIKISRSHKEALLSHSQMNEFYHSIDYYLCASWNEGTPNPALEAAACGVPVVTTKVGNMPELIQEGVNGYFIHPTVDSIVKKFNDIQSLSFKDYEKLTQNIRRTIVKEWSWEERIRNFTKAFQVFIS